MTAVVVVESPAKAKTINKYLGKDYVVLASYGHVRDLPAKDGSVRPDEDFAMSWEVDPKASKRLNDIAQAVKGAERLILSTDPDREGEAISWHVLENLRGRRGVLKDVAVERVTFNAITRGAVVEAMKKPRQIDMELVDAYLARRALDYLVGFNLSPVLWRKLPGARSAGRVQSVALRLVVERELEIEAFRTQEYWTVEADVASGSDPFLARLVKHEGKRLAKFDLPNEQAALDAKAAVEQGRFTITAVEKKPGKRTPPPPFTTSTLQQEASRKLGFDAKRTMQAAQRLYEGVDVGGETQGLITYMRTDGVQTTPEALDDARKVIGLRFGGEYVPEQPRFYKTKAKNAQEAHEAIRPTSMARHPGTMKLESDMQRLYELIWRRMIASQMEAARIESTTVDMETADGRTGLRATGQVVLFDGYLAVYQEGRDEAADSDEDRRLPAVSEGNAAEVRAARADQHFTEPPPRYTEATLVKKMEELGIGRPSTYATILSVLRDRAYVRMDRNRFVPEDSGRLVTAFLEEFFERYVEYDFTAGLEEKLDQVSAGDLDYKALLREFWGDFHATTEEVLERKGVIDQLDGAIGGFLFPQREDGTDPRLCPVCGEGRLHLKASFKGKSSFIGCSNYPQCRYTRAFGSGANTEVDVAVDRELGADPDTGQAVWLKVGRFGPYVQLGEAVGKDDKPKRSSLPKGWAAADLDLQKGLRLLRLPRTVGAHPEDGEPILAGLGRYGPFVQHGKTYANLPDVEEVFEVGLNRAVALIAEKRSGGGARGRSSTQPLRELGAHPRTGDPVVVMPGRYGEYIKAGKTNVTLPRGADVDSLTLDQAVKLVDAKAGLDAVPKDGPPSKGGRKPAAKKPAAKVGAKKPAMAKRPARVAAAPVAPDEEPPF